LCGSFAISFAAPDDGKIVANTEVVPSANLQRRLSEADRAMLEQVDIKAITYLSDGLQVKGYLVVPKAGERLPAVIYNRGGNREFGALTDRTAATELARIASWGYVVVASQYRGNRGGEGHEEFGGADVHDVLNLIPLLEAQPRVDAARLGMIGWSRGGMMACIALTQMKRIAAAVLASSELDAFDTLRRRPDMEPVYSELVPHFQENREAAMIARSPLRWPEKMNPNTPLLLLHGSADWRVDPSQALAMANALYAAKRPFRFVFFEGGDHGLTQNTEEVWRLTRNWFDTYVRDRKPWPSLEQHGR
jgi:dipeptidyl aminopeptidase/acylaminoacyl peptidase